MPAATGDSSLAAYVRARLDPSLSWRDVAWLRSRTKLPILVKGDGPLAAGVVPLPGRELAFRTERLGRPADVRLVPFWQISYDRYTVYWDVITEAEWMYRTALRQPGT